MIQKASRLGLLINGEGKVIQDAFDNSWPKAKNKTYQKYAEEILSIWKELNGIS